MKKIFGYRTIKYERRNRKEMAKKTAHKKSASSKKASVKKNGFLGFYHKHRTAAHGIAAGTVLVLLKGLLAIIGIAVLAASVIAIIRKQAKKA